MNTGTSPQIIFKSNPMYSFYGLWCDCIQNPNAAKKALEGFNDPSLSKIADIIPQRGTKTHLAIEKIHQLIGKYNISTIDEVKPLMRESFSASDVENYNKVLEPAFAAYSSFFAQNKEKIDNNIETLNSGQQAYSQDFAKLYQCFATPSEKVCNCFLNPFPQDKVADGISNKENVSMNYSLNRNENRENYIGNSNILKRKSSTPFHEATHFLFFNSQLKKDIENEKNPEMSKLLNHIITKFEKKGNSENKPSRDQLKFFATGAINEAFAACSTALYNEKTTGKPVSDNNEWYHGWQEANDLTRQMYPHYKEYVNSGTLFDDNFFRKLNTSIKIENLKNADKSQTTEKHQPSKISELRGIGNAIAQAKAPYKPHIFTKSDISSLKYFKERSVETK